MGLFDHFKIDVNLLPLSEEEKLTIKTEFQTKDFDNEMTNVEITNDGKLRIEKFKYEVVPKEERPYPNDDGIKGLFGSLKRTNCHWIYYDNFTGSVNFYNRDYGFEAIFITGNLDKILKIENC